MPSGPRIRANNVFGITTDNPLSAVATSFNSASLFLLPVVSSAHAIIVLDPKRVNGEPEIVVVTAHTALATSATISRAAYGTTARSHPVGTQWAHVVVTDDVVPIVTSSTRPSDPYEGQYIYETDTHRPAHRDNTQWLPGGPVSVVTSGTRPANPYEGQTIFETDTHRPVHRDNTQWLPGGPVSIVTSGSRPANPYTGQIIFETDTARTLHWDGTQWTTYRVGGEPDQLFGYNLANGTATSMTAFFTQNSLLSLPYQYKMIVQAHFNTGANAVANVLTLQVQDESGVHISPKGTINGSWIRENHFSSETAITSILAEKNYAAGATCGFRLAYQVNTSNIFLDGIARVSFQAR